MTQPFPTLRIRANSLTAEGAFAESQARFLRPNQADVAALDALLAQHDVGIVAHFYMDPELQGVLSAASWPHIHISDSLLMADHAVRMAQQGIRAVLVLGVDFMSENVRAVLDAAGHRDIPVYRLAAEPIGCSLAESAEQDAYATWLAEAGETSRSLHVVYINTSLATKARAQAALPTITCTSSNVVRTLLQAGHQIPDVHLWYGPDTYMGENLGALLRSLIDLGDEAIRSVHAGHDRESVRSLLERYRYFQDGICVVHHMFGHEVAHQIREIHPDAYVTAHLEVPGPMFKLGLEKANNRRGVVGSTSDILRFIERTTRQSKPGDKLEFVLGTEAGMVTSIVRSVQSALRGNGRASEVGIVFPVASEAISQNHDAELPVVPGVQGGEGCSIEGGCATCPYMKMNSLSALMTVLDEIGTPNVKRFAPVRRTSPRDGHDLVDLGTQPIFAMRAFQEHGTLPANLVERVMATGRANSA